MLNIGIKQSVSVCVGLLEINAATLYQLH